MTIRRTATRAQYLAARASQKVRSRAKDASARHDIARLALRVQLGTSNIAPIPTAWREEADRQDRLEAARRQVAAIQHLLNTRPISVEISREAEAAVSALRALENEVTK